MTVTNIWVGKKHTVKVNDEKYSFKDYMRSKKVRQYLVEGICMNTIGSITDSSPTEKALLVMMDKLGINIEQQRNDHLPEDFTRF
jgi:magnesium-transporting ATPase (P-type)